MEIQLKIIHKQEMFSRANKALLQKAFQMYQETWAEIFKIQDNFCSDTFLRQELHILLLDADNNVCAYCAMSKHDFSIPLFKQQSYFSEIPMEGIRAIKELAISNVYSIELLTISPSYRKKRHHLDFYSILRQILVNITRDIQAKHVIAPTVKTNSASKEGQKHGDIICANIIYKGLLCNLLYFNEKTAVDINDEILKRKVNKLYDEYRDSVLFLKFPDEEENYESFRKFA
ncbi:hypothetical protein ABMA70_04060 [Halobacteriovorax sp. XZX-3]|uniref:hypothetical protein n=1 Tax=unclassified Halobacteriovorax TaxID=2639665 RepID=UPI0037141815